MTWKSPAYKPRKYGDGPVLSRDGGVLIGDIISLTNELLERVRVLEGCKKPAREVGKLVPMAEMAVELNALLGRVGVLERAAGIEPPRKQFKKPLGGKKKPKSKTFRKRV